MPSEEISIGAVDAGAVVEAHPACLDRVLRAPGGSTWPARSPAQAESGTCQDGLTCLSSIV